MTADYLKLANDSVLVLTQVETRQAYDNIEAICAVEGLSTIIATYFCSPTQ